MTLFFLVLLAGLWGVVFLPALLRARQGASPIISVSTFNKGMRALGAGQPSSDGRWVVMPPGPSETSERRLALERRRRVFTSLIAACALTLVPALMGLPGIFWLHLALDCILGCFVGFLIHNKQADDRRELPADPAPRFTGDLDPATVYSGGSHSVGRHSAPSPGYSITPAASPVLSYSSANGQGNGPYIFDAEDDELYVTAG